MGGTQALLGSAFVVALLNAFALPAIAGAACGPLKVMASLPLTPLSPGNVATVPVTIGDIPKAFLVDTGAFTSYVSQDIVREFNLQTGPSPNGFVTMGVTGQISDQVTRLPSITIGTMRQDGPMFFVDERGMPFDGIIGSNMLSYFDADFDFGANKFNLISQDHCPGQVTYWTAPKLAVVPFSLDRSGHITFRIQLDDRRVTAMLDTGASNTILNLNAARRTFNVDVNGPDVEKAGELNGIYSADVYRRRFKTIAFEGVVVRDPTLILLPDMMRQGLEAPRTGSLVRERDAGLPDIILGMSVLSKLHLYVAYKERKLYITEAGATSAAPPPVQ